MITELLRTIQLEFAKIAQEPAIAASGLLKITVLIVNQE